MAKTLGPVRRDFAPWESADAKPFIRFRNVIKRFGDFTAIDSLNLDIYEREFFALLGPSGCGKTTLMRMLAGFETPTSGEIELDGVDLANTPPYRRPVNMMFQSYALFPHMSVRGNIAFGLKQDRLPKSDIDQRVEEMLSLVKLEPFASRKPDQLSGGQRQRVALARSLAKRPKVLLLDEPLGALDKKLREETQFELMDIQERLGMTFLIVTHDQEEAMTVADRIAVMNHGNLVQVASPAEIYEVPKTRYIADFIGDINILEGKVSANAEQTVDVTTGSDENQLVVRVTSELAPALEVGESVFFAIRPEKLRISPADTASEEPPPSEEASSSNSVMGSVYDIAYLGDVSIYHVKLDSGQMMRATLANATRLVERPIGWEERVELNWDLDSGIILVS